jgi:hypothetical protein
MAIDQWMYTLDANEAITHSPSNTTFSPQGRLHQVEYALEAVKQGSAAVGLRSNTHVVLLALKVTDRPGAWPLDAPSFMDRSLKTMIYLSLIPAALNRRTRKLPEETHQDR